MNAFRIRTLFIMLGLGLGPLTLLIVGLRFLPGGLLPWIWYGLLACVTIALAIGASGAVSRPLSDAIAAFVTLFRTGGKHKPRTWVPTEYSAMQESLTRLVADHGSRCADIERSLSAQAAALAEAESAAIRGLEVLHAVVDSASEGIVFVHADGHVAMINTRASELLSLTDDYAAPGIGIATWLENVVTQFQNSSDLLQTLTSWQRTASGLYELEAELAGDEPRLVTLRSVDVRRDGTTLLGRLWLFRENSDQRRATQRLRVSQKMESIGQLAGGIAHDFNNLLTAIRGNLTMAELVEDQKEYRDRLQGATRATVRAAELVRQLLGYSRRSDSTKASTDITHLVSETRSILRSSIDPRVAIRTNVEPAIWQACADPVQLEQVLLNLCLNARDALPEKGGVIDISAFNLAAKPGADADHPSAKNQVTLRIRDNGTGIPLEAREHIFEPYFTTKAADKGTGLGLAMARTIIEEAGGRIEFDSELGKGTEFRLYFPANISVADPELSVEATATKPVRDSRTGTLLVVDDEAPVRSIAAQMLRYLGYKVVEAADGIEAISKLESSDVPFDAVLLDVYMPKLSGRDTYKALRERGLNVPVIVCSGFTVEPDEFTALSSNRRGGVVQVIQKPYSMESLAHVVMRAVGATSPNDEVLAA